MKASSYGKPQYLAFMDSTVGEVVRSNDVRGLSDISDHLDARLYFLARKHCADHSASREFNKGV